MYLYLYAPFLRGRKYARELALIEGRITDFGITGKIAQLSQFLKFPAAIKEFGARRLTTLVVVGDDALLEEAVNACALTQVVVGYIPMTESAYARGLAIPKGAPAVETLAARRIAKVDAGKVHNRFFFGALKTQGRGIELHTPTFSIFPKDRAALEIANFFSGQSDYPARGLLSITVTPIEGALFHKTGVPTRICAASCRIKSRAPLGVQLANLLTLKTPLQVDIVPEAVRMVVGRSVAQKKREPQAQRRRRRK